MVWHTFENKIKDTIIMVYSIELMHNYQAFVKQYLYCLISKNSDTFVFIAVGDSFLYFSSFFGQRTMVQWSTLKSSVRIRVVKLSSFSTTAKSRFEAGKPFPASSFADCSLAKEFVEIAKWLLCLGRLTYLMYYNKLLPTSFGNQEMYRKEKMEKQKRVIRLLFRERKLQ